jgi:hypothetical protein
MPADWNRRRRGVGYLSAGHVQDIPVHSAAVPDSRRSRKQVSDTSWEALGRSRYDGDEREGSVNPFQDNQLSGTVA